MDSVTCTELSGRTVICASNFSIRSSLASAGNQHRKQSSAGTSHRTVIRRAECIRDGTSGRGRGRVETDLWRFALRGGGYFEKFTRLEAKHARENIRGELLNFGVQVTDDSVVVAAGILNRIFDLRERILEGRKAFNGAKLGIRLGQREETLERAGEHVFRLRFVDRAGCRHCAIASVNDRFERSFFVPSIALDRFDEVGDQVVAALELHVDVGPGVVHLNFQAYQAVVQPDQNENDQYQTNQQNPADHVDLTQRSVWESIPRNYTCGVDACKARLAAIPVEPVEQQKG